MKPISKALGDAAVDAEPRESPSRIATDRRLADNAHEELVAMGMPRVNLLLMGRQGATQGVLDKLTAGLHQPIASWMPGVEFVLPPVDRTGTMVLHDVGALAIDEQIRLLEWLGGAVGHTQVVSTTAGSLLPRIRAGAFIDMLYYRLNTVCVEVTD